MAGGRFESLGSVLSKQPVFFLYFRILGTFAATDLT